MSRATLFLTCLAVMGLGQVVGVTPGRAGADEAQNERKALQGTWVFTKYIADGTSDKGDETQTFTFKNNTFVEKIKGESNLEGKFTLDVASNPRRIVLMDVGGERKVRIYEVKGNTLKLAEGADDASPPDDFSGTQKGAFVKIFTKRK